MASALLASARDYRGGEVPPDLATSFGGDAGLVTPATMTHDDDAAFDWWRHWMCPRGEKQELETERDHDINDQARGGAVLSAPAAQGPARARKL